MADDLIGALRALANKWARRAQESSRDAKAGGEPESAAYQRGLAEGYYKAATELAEVIRNQPAAAAPKPAASPSAPISSSSDAKPNPNAGGRWGSTRSSSLPQAAPRPAAPAADPEPAAAAASTSAEAWAAVDVSEVLNMLQYAGTTPRDVQVRPDNTVLAIFSRWENLTPPQRQEKVQKADFRLVIVEAGFTKDTRDPYLIFGFRNGR
jgi:hypothetical protein